MNYSPKNCEQGVTYADVPGGPYVCGRNEGWLTRVLHRDGRQQWLCDEHATEAAGPNQMSITCGCGLTTLVAL